MTTSKFNSTIDLIKTVKFLSKEYDIPSDILCTMIDELDIINIDNMPVLDLGQFIEFARFNFGTMILNDLLSTVPQTLNR